MRTLLKSITPLASLFFGAISYAHGGAHHSGLAAHLSFKQNTVHIHARFPTAPVVGQESLLVLDARDARTHQAIELNDNIEVVLWMPSMNHGSALTQVERAVDANGNILAEVYNVRNVYFIMGGDWEVRITLTDAQGVRETKSFLVTLGGGHHHGGHH